jgi:hypothetical protein
MLSMRLVDEKGGRRRIQAASSARLLDKVHSGGDNFSRSATNNRVKIPLATQPMLHRAKRRGIRSRSHRKDDAKKDGAANAPSSNLTA